jgi:hypothetical protein
MQHRDQVPRLLTAYEEVRQPRCKAASVYEYHHQLLLRLGAPVGPLQVLRDMALQKTLVAKAGQHIDEDLENPGSAQAGQASGRGGGFAKSRGENQSRSRLSCAGKCGAILGLDYIYNSAFLISILNNPTSTPATLANGLPQASTFFFTHVFITNPSHCTL